MYCNSNVCFIFVGYVIVLNKLLFLPGDAGNVRPLVDSDCLLVFLPLSTCAGCVREMSENVQDVSRARPITIQ